MSLSIMVLLLVAVTLGEGFTGVPRTYNLQTEEERYGKYERVLLGLKSSEGLNVDSKVLDKVREVLFEEEAAHPTSKGEKLVAVHLDRPKQSQEVAQFQYRNRIKFG
ncbi:uncharacterized protein LOC129723893 [Wyeomyia smithii]|uniref:uncharacterized protein LOC129723893 n=1 Tax=Wyeomyia smithii TaxID=174621 RepID=UPI00246819B7|nr:uncharacterized protein LOC129723893 [Wyeomyia smithii]